jgi:metallo-beta-lactamase family protein
MLLDSGQIQERDVEYVNKRRKKRGEPPVEPLYTKEDATASLDYFITQAYYRQRQIAPGVRLTFRDAGHMLGSTIVVLDIEDRDQEKGYRLVFSGDIGRAGIPIIRDPDTVEFADYLIMESTYGNRTHIAYDAETHNLERIINEAHQRGGRIIIPAFSVGRTQQLVFMLNQLTAAGTIPKLPIYVDSPLAIDATSVFKLHPEVYDEETRDFIMQGNGRNEPLSFANLTYTRKVEDSKKLNDLNVPAIIISASGMMENGRILHHLKNNIEDPNTTVLVVGWQAPDTLGRKLVDGESEVRIFGDEYQNNAHVEVMNGFSGHADRDELLAWVGAMQRKPKQTFLVHGEPESADALAAALKERFDMQVDVPELHQSFEVN